MNWTDISNLGTILEDHDPNQADVEPAAIFLREVFMGFIKASAHFYEQIGELPFIYRERQVQAELLPAIHAVADAVLVEQLIDRKKGRNVGTGRLDYAVRYQKQYVFFIELKFAWVAVNSVGVRQELLNAWAEAHAQLDYLDDDELIDFAADLGVEDRSKIFKMALLIAPSYERANNSHSLEAIVDRTIIEEIHQRLLAHLEDPSADLSYTWALPRELQEPLEYDEVWCETYPCVSFVAGVEPL